MDQVLKDENEFINTHTQGEHHVMMKAETEVMCLYVKEHQGLLTTAISWKTGREHDPAITLILDF